MAASDANDPDLQAKDADLHLLNVSERTRKRHRFGTDNVWYSIETPDRLASDILICIIIENITTSAVRIEDSVLTACGTAIARNNGFYLYDLMKDTWYRSAAPLGDIVVPESAGWFYEDSRLKIILRTEAIALIEFGDQTFASVWYRIRSRARYVGHLPSGGRIFTY